MDCSRAAGRVRRSRSSRGLPPVRLARGGFERTTNGRYGPISRAFLAIACFLNTNAHRRIAAVRSRAVAPRVGPPAAAQRACTGQDRRCRRRPMGTAAVVGTRGACVGQGPMVGVKVVEMGVWIAGPAAGGVLADWGADVVKIEPPAGDPARTFQQMLGGDMPTNPVFELDNRGKRSIVLDLGTDEGRDLALRLIDDADVFVSNMRMQALQRMGFGHEALLERNPRLVYAHISGLRLGGRGRQSAGVRHLRVLGASRHRRAAARSRRRPAVPARRHGRPLRRRADRRRDLGGAVLPGAHREGPAGLLVTPAPGRVHDRVRPQPRARVGPDTEDRRAPSDAQPVHQQLRGRRRPLVLDRRPRGRSPLAAARPLRRPSRVARRRPLPHAEGSGRERRRADRPARRDLRDQDARRVGGGVRHRAEHVLDRRHATGRDRQRPAAARRRWVGGGAGPVRHHDDDRHPRRLLGHALGAAVDRSRPRRAHREVLADELGLDDAAVADLVARGVAHLSDDTGI